MDDSAVKKDPETQPTFDNHDPFVYVLDSVPGTIFAMIAYPFVVALIVFALTVCLGGLANFDGSYLIIFLSVVLGGVGIAFVVSLFVAPLAAFAVATVNYSLGSPMNHKSVVISAGSLAGYTPLSFVFLQIYSRSPMDLGGMLTVSVVGPILAACMGAYGARWSAER